MSLKLVDLVKGTRGFLKVVDKSAADVLSNGFGTGEVNTIPRGKELVLADQATLCLEIKIRGDAQETFAVLAFERKPDKTVDETKHHIIYVGSMFRQIDPVGKRENPEFTHPTDTKGTTSTHELLEKMKKEQLCFKFDEEQITWDIKLANKRPDGTEIVKGRATKWNWVD